MRFIKNQGGETVAILIEDQPRKDGIEFFTDPALPIQVARMFHKVGHVIAEHKHVEVLRMVRGTPEVLLVKKGKIAATIDGQFFTLYAGDVLILLSGTHGFVIQQDAEIWEVKQGPYLGDQDKVLTLAPLWEGGPHV